MNEEELRVLFAAFAMLKMAWHKGEEDEDAKDCWYLAEKMLTSRMQNIDGGIAAIKPRRTKDERG